MTNHIESIKSRQTKSRLGDGLFAVAIAVAAILSVTSVGTAVAAGCNQPAHTASTASK